MRSTAQFIRLRLVVAAVLMAACAFAAPAVGQDASEDYGVFLPVDVARLEPAGRAARPQVESPLVVRSRSVGVDLEAFSPLTDVLDRGGVLPALRLNLFEDVVVESVVEAVDRTASGYSWSGGIAGDPMGSVAVAVNGSVVSGVVRTGGREYEIRSVGDGRHTIREVDRSGLPGGAPPLRPRSALEDPDPRALTDDPGRVDIAVFYTRAARRDAGGTDEIHALIDAWIADTNGAYLRSEIHHRLNLVLREEVSYREGEDSEDNSVAKQAVECLREDDDDCLDAVHARREEYSADLVYLVISSSVDEYPRTCGIAYQTGDFAASHLDCGSDTFAHEVGHNSGVNHDRYVEYDDECEADPDTPCFDDYPSAYAYGYVNPHGLDTGAPLERSWFTLMAYRDQCIDEDAPCQQLMRFSNPDQSWYGDELGVHGTRGLSSYRSATDAARRGPADAARTHNEFAHDLANRISREVPDLTVKGLHSNRLQAEPRTTVRLNAVVHNLGTATIEDPDTEVTWCRARRSGCGSSVGEPTAVPQLASNARASVSTTVELPSSHGTYSYRACVSSVTGETLTENNCSETVDVEVGAVDLRYSMTLSRHTVAPGAEVVISGVVRNRGTIASSLVQVQLHKNFDGEWERVRSRNIQSIRARGSATFEMAVEAPEAAGVYRLATCLWSSHVESSCVQERLTVR